MSVLWWPHARDDSEAEAPHGDVQVGVTGQVQPTAMNLLEVLAQASCTLTDVRAVAIMTTGHFLYCLATILAVVLALSTSY